MIVSRRLRNRTNLQKQRLILYGLLGLLGVFVLGFVILLGLFAWYSRGLPPPGQLAEVSDNSTVFYDRNGKVLFNIYKDKNRVPVSLNDISKYLKEATVSTEDKNFYQHHGVSQTGIIRAFINILLGRGTQGGSTITQQLVKNVFLSPQQQLSRKIREAILAEEVERKYTKDQILEMYLNEIPYGGSYYGIGSAAKGYFGKDPKDLTLIESAILAGLPQSPSYYSPFIGKKDAWKGRTKDVLRRMREDHDITDQQEQDALKQMDSIVFTSPKLAIEAPHYVFYVKRQIEEKYGSKIFDQGLKVKTTLDLDLQKKVEQIVKDEIGKLKGYNATNGAVVVLDSQTGDILAYVGSYDYNDDKYGGQFDVASQGSRQPGSALKPILYATAFEKGYTPATVLMDVKTDFTPDGKEHYIPVNYDGKFHGPVQIRFALGNSMNIPAVKMLAMIGMKDFLQKCADMGMSSLAPTDENLRNLGLSAALGGGATNLLDLTSAYSVFARGGTKIDIQNVEEIDDFKGKSLYKSVKSNPKQVLSPEVSFLISHILSDNNARIAEFGPNSYLNVPGKTVSVKTGTTNDKRDNYAVGYTKSVTVGVWVGNNDNSPMNDKIASGVTGASPIWHDIMVELLKKYSDGIPAKPDKVKALEIDAFLGGLPKDGQPKRTEYFIDGTEPKDVSPSYKKVKISKANGKLANDIEIKNGNYDEKDFYVFQENDPVSTDGTNRWQQGINDWAKDQPDDKYHVPTEVSDASADDVVVSMKSPDDHQTVGNDFTIKAHITSVANIKNVKIFLNGSEIKNYDGNNPDIEFPTHQNDGTYEIRVEAHNDKDVGGTATIHIGVNKPWDSGQATPTPTPTPSPTHDH